MSKYTPTKWLVPLVPPYHTTVSWLCYDGYVDPPKRVSHSLALLTRFDVRFDSSPYSTVPSKTHKMVKKFTYPPERYQHIETIYITIYHHISPLISPIQKIPIDWKSMGVTPSHHPPTSMACHLRARAKWARFTPGEGRSGGHESHLVATWWPPGGHLVLLRWFLPLKQLGKSYPLVN